MVGGEKKKKRKYGVVDCIGKRSAFVRATMGTCLMFLKEVKRRDIVQFYYY
jgi:hypothetical protein